MNTNIKWFWIIVILSALDGTLTNTIISLGGGEANPYTNYVMNLLGNIGGMSIIKIPPLLGLGYLVYYYQEKIDSYIWITYVLKGVAGIYSGVILYSLYVLYIVGGVL